MLGRVKKNIILTKMSKVVFKATPGVFGDKGFNKTPGLLFVFDISVNPEQREITSSIIY